MPQIRNNAALQGLSSYSPFQKKPSDFSTDETVDVTAPDTVLAGLRQGSFENSPELSSYKNLSNLERETDQRRNNAIAVDAMRQQHPTEQFGQTPGLRTLSSTPPTGVQPNYGIGASTDTVAGLSDQLVGLMNQRDRHPLTQHAAQGQALNQQWDAAKQSGFESPMAAAGYQRQQEMAKVNMPLSVEQERTRGQLGERQLQNQGALDVLGKQQQYANEGVDTLQKMFNTTKEPFSMTSPGIGSVTRPQLPSGAFPGSKDPVAYQLLQTVTAARDRVAKEGERNATWSHPLDGEVSPAKQALDSAVGNVISRSPEFKNSHLDDNMKRFLVHMWSQQDTKDFTVEDMLRSAGENQVTPEELTEMKRLMTAVRGY